MSEHEAVAAAAAIKFRDNNGLGIAPIPDIVALIEQTQGVDVAVLDVADSNEHGLTMVDPKRGVTIAAVARSMKPMRWRSTLAHELGHLVFADHLAGQPASLADTPAENRARAFARHLLLTAGAVDHFVAGREVLDLPGFSALVQRFQISPVIAAIQLHDGGHIDRVCFDEWSVMSTPSIAAQFGWMDQYRALQAASNQRRAPQRLLARAVAGYRTGIVTIETLAGIRGLSTADLTAELRDVGIVPTGPRQVATSPTSDDIDGAGDFIDVSWMDDQ